MTNDLFSKGYSIQKGCFPMKENRDRSEKIRKEIGMEVIDDVVEVQKNFRLHHKVLYTLSIFTGVVLVWYGFWDIVPMVPILNNPFVAIACGFAILAATSSFFRELG